AFSRKVLRSYAKVTCADADDSYSRYNAALNGMPYRLHRCVECPKCHTRYIMGANPYGNGSYIVSHVTVESDLLRLFCSWRLADYQECKLIELNAYAAPHSVYER